MFVGGPIVELQHTFVGEVQQNGIALRHPNRRDAPSGRFVSLRRQGGVARFLELGIGRRDALAPLLGPVDGDEKSTRARFHRLMHEVHAEPNGFAGPGS